jgi:type II secretory pathway component PulF
MEGRKELSGIKSVASALRQEVREGGSLSGALRVVSPSFGDLYCNLVSAGEISGSLPQLLKRQATFLVTIDDLQKKVVSALIYPALIFFLGVGLIFLFMTYLVPQLTQLFQKTGKDLPMLTRLLVQTSDVFSHYWWAMILAVVSDSGNLSEPLSANFGGTKYSCNCRYLGPYSEVGSMRSFLRRWRTC